MRESLNHSSSATTKYTACLIVNFHHLNQAVNSVDTSSKHVVSRSVPTRTMTAITISPLLLILLSCTVSSSLVPDAAPEDGFIRGQCPRAEDIHPCVSVPSLSTFTN